MRDEPGFFKRTSAPTALVMTHEQPLSEIGFPLESIDGIPTQQLQRGNPGVAVDQDVLTAVGDDGDRNLLPDLRQRRDKPPGPSGATDPLIAVANIQLMKLQLHLVTVAEILAPPLSRLVALRGQVRRFAA